jgi:hypothetical protein
MQPEQQQNEWRLMMQPVVPRYQLCMCRMHLSNHNNYNINNYNINNTLFRSNNRTR